MKERFRLIILMVCLMTLGMGCSVSLNGDNSGISDVFMGNSGSVNNGKESDATVKKTVRIGRFTEVEASQGIKVVFTQGKFTGEARIATTPSAEKYLSVTTKDGTLKACYTGKFNRIEGPSIIYVQAPDLKEIDLSSSASFQMKGKLAPSGKLEVDLSSAASVSMDNVQATEIDLSLSSSSSFRAGKLDLGNLDADLSSAANAEIAEVIAQKVDAEASSASSLIINQFDGGFIDADASSGAKIEFFRLIAQDVKAQATSGASIHLEGSCGNTSISSSSGGNVNRSGLKVSHERSETPGKQNKSMPQIP